MPLYLVDNWDFNFTYSHSVIYILSSLTVSIDYTINMLIISSFYVGDIDPSIS